MTPIRVTLGIFGVTLALGGYGAGPASMTPAEPGRPAAATLVTPSSSSLTVSLDADDRIVSPSAPYSAPRLDLYGNPVEDAVSDYRFDPGGDTYERHSPDTEVARLSPPES